MRDRSDVSRLSSEGVSIVAPYAAELEQRWPELRFCYNPTLHDRDDIKNAACAFLRSHNIAIIAVFQTKRDIAESQHSTTRTFFSIKGKTVNA